MNSNSSEQKLKVTTLFDTVAAGYDGADLRFFPFCADQIVRLLKPKPGQKVLDVATGTGAVAVALAQALRPDGRVIGIDLSESMLAQAERNIKKMALANVDLFQMDAESLEFKRDYFDASVCSFGVFFMPNMDKALKELVRVTKTGGKVMISSFFKSAFEPMRSMLLEGLAEFGVEPSKLKFSSQKLTDPADCQELLERAGLTEVKVQQQQLGYHLQSADQWWSIQWNSGARRLIAQLNEEQRAQFRLEHTAAIQKLATENGIWMDVEVLISSGVVV